MGTTKKRTRAHMTVGMLEDELVRLKKGLGEVIKVLEAMDRREPVTTIEDDRIPGGARPWACPVVGWDCDEKVWSLKPQSRQVMTAATRRAILKFINGVIPCMGRIDRYIDKYTKV